MRRIAVVIVCIIVAACDESSSGGGPSPAQAMRAINEASNAEALKAAGFDPRWSNQVSAVKSLTCTLSGEDMYDCDVLVIEPILASAEGDEPVWGEIETPKRYRFLRQDTEWRAARID